jgi:hypothetical protein
MEKQIQHFDTRAGFQEQLRACISRATTTLQLFDPDFAIWELGSSQMDALLRHFLSHRGRLDLVAHSNTELELHAPRFKRLLRDYGHAVACRRTSPELRHLTDSFCIADHLHTVRRYHSDHFRGEAVYDAALDTQVYGDRFTAIWEETVPGLNADTTGL